MVRIAVLQMTSGTDPEANFETIESAAREAAANGSDGRRAGGAGGGATILFTPEMSILLDRDRGRAGKTMAQPRYCVLQERLAQLAQDTGVDIALGSMPVPLVLGKAANRSCYFPADGGTATSYDKLHMFDVDLATGESWRESSAYEAGGAVVTRSDTPVGRLGFAICYDMRFPALFDALGRARCDAIAVPSAFTRPTGAAHWHVLLRARAVEASAFVIAPAQVGEHEDGRETYGHSIVVDPWGEVLLDMGGNTPGLATCDIDLDRIADVRAQVPSLANRREMPKSAGQ